ncbi:MAG: hypothetical protein QG559_1561 [Campylobacterota bacterium]|nr:hypothetical protein [Campylobacterota bacterium]
MKTTTLTNEEFITRSMAGEVFILNGDKFYYDITKYNPFRCNTCALDILWQTFNGKTIFEIEEPKPTMERRWKWRRDSFGYTVESGSYMSDIFVGNNNYSVEGWYKVEDLYIDVEIK